MTGLHAIEYCTSAEDSKQAVLDPSSGHAEFLRGLGRELGTEYEFIATNAQKQWRPGARSSPVHIVIEISERVEVPAAPRIVWGVLSDPRAVVECMPGAKLGDRLEDGSYDAALTVKFGPARVTFRAKVALELDGTAMTGHVSSRGRDDQGGTRVKTAMTFKVVAGQEPGSSAVPIDAQVEISGRLASLVESGATLVVKRMTSEFTERLAARCANATA